LRAHATVSGFTESDQTVIPSEKLRWVVPKGEPCKRKVELFN
jgi:hypothetical protein